jgi:hypothetical protein
MGCVVKCRALRFSALLCGSAYCSAVQCIALRFSVLLYGSAYCSAVQRIALRFSVLLCGSAYCSAVQRIALRFSVLLCGSAQGPAVRPVVDRRAAARGSFYLEKSESFCQARRTTLLFFVFMGFVSHFVIWVMSTERIDASCVVLFLFFFALLSL